jgi:acetyl-CoA acetyltransferase
VFLRLTQRSRNGISPAVHGLNNVVEAMRQLRREAVAHQVPEPEFALCTGFGGSYGSATILRRA